MTTLRPTLSSLGITDEVEANVCPDTSKNRAILREREVKFDLLPGGFIEVDLTQLDPSSKDASIAERNKYVLKNPKNIWGDYLPFEELPLDFWETAPAWMVRLRNEYEDAVDRDVPEHKLPILPTRCRRMRGDGSRCWNWSWGKTTEGFCRYHAPAGSFDYANEFKKMSEAAQARLQEMQPLALAALEELVLDRTTVPHVRLKAAENILDRTGLNSKQQIDVNTTVTHEIADPAQAIRDRLSQLAARATPALPASVQAETLDDADILDISDAEVIEVEMDS